VDYAVVVDAFEVLPASCCRDRTRFEETATSFSGTWTAADTSSPGWSGALRRLHHRRGRGHLGFVAPRWRWIGQRGPRNGIARVFLDGSFHATVR